MNPTIIVTESGVLRDWLRLLRPQQWVKNAFVLTPLLFSGHLAAVADLLHALAAFAIFCGLASAVYAFNDVTDRQSDQAHPSKRHRPVAAGRISVATAQGTAALLAIVALGGAAWLGTAVLQTAVAYLLLNVAYSIRLKRIVIVDVFCIAAFFVLRLLAGARAIDVRPSIWLLLCGGLLALYLGFAKRRHERLLLGEGSSDHRSVLADYNPVFLDQISIVLLSVTVVAYIMYTLSPERIASLGGSYRLTYSTAFVLYGVFRYLYLVQARAGGSPTETLLNDRPLMAAVLLWVLYCGWVIYQPF